MPKENYLQGVKWKLLQRWTNAASSRTVLSLSSLTRFPSMMTHRDCLKILEASLVHTQLPVDMVVYVSFCASNWTGERSSVIVLGILYVPLWDLEF